MQRPQTTQMALIEDTGTEWRMDETTRRLGRKGVAQARAALRAALASRDAA